MESVGSLVEARVERVSQLMTALTRTTNDPRRPEFNILSDTELFFPAPGWRGSLPPSQTTSSVETRVAAPGQGCRAPVVGVREIVSRETFESADPAVVVYLKCPATIVAHARQGIDAFKRIARDPKLYTQIPVMASFC